MRKWLKHALVTVFALVLAAGLLPVTAEASSSYISVDPIAIRQGVTESVEITIQTYNSALFSFANSAGPSHFSFDYDGITVTAADVKSQLQVVLSLEVRGGVRPSGNMVTLTIDSGAFSSSSFTQVLNVSVNYHEATYTVTVHHKYYDSNVTSSYTSSYEEYRGLHYGDRVPIPEITAEGYEVKISPANLNELTVTQDMEVTIEYYPIEDPGTEDDAPPPERDDDDDDDELETPPIVDPAPEPKPDDPGEPDDGPVPVPEPGLDSDDEGDADTGSGSIFDTPAPDPEPAGALIDLPPGWDMIPPPKKLPVSPIQNVVRSGREIVKWIERVNLPEYVNKLYENLVNGSDPESGNTPSFLINDDCFTLSAGGSPIPGQSVVEVECVDFDLAELFAAEDVSLGTASFENEDFYRVDDLGAQQVDYAKLKMGDVVKTSTFNGVFITSIPKDNKYDEAKKAAAAYISTVYQAFDRDHPEVFWLSGSCKLRISVVKTADGSQMAYFFLVLVDNNGFTMRSPDWVKDGAVADGIKRREAAIETILGNITAETPAEIVQQLNCWLTEHNQYNTTPDLTTIGNEPHECLSALEGRIDRNGPVCDGYSRAFKALCDRLNILCVLENGYAKVSPDSTGTLHMWNAVEIGGQWYGVDVTWNDPTVKGFVGAKSGKENEQFLLVGADTIVQKMTFSASHPATNKASVDGVFFDNGPSLSSVAFSAVTANTGMSSLPFADVAESAWYYDYIAYVYEKKLMLGTAEGQFSPGGSTTRQQLWMILARMDGENPKDMDAARAWAVGSGVSDGTNPAGQLTREQLVTMLYRYCQSKGRDVSKTTPLASFSDAGTISGYAAQAMSWAVSEKIITGMGDNTITPHGSATRAQMAAILQRISK